MRSLSLAIVAFCLGVPCGASAFAAQQPAAATAVDPERARIATAIINSIDPDDIAVNSELRGWEVGIRGLMNRDPGIAKLNGEHPGLIDAAVAAGRPLAADYLKTAVATMKARKAEVLARRLTLAELNQVHAFVSSEAGQRLYQRLHASADVGKISKDVLDRAEESGSLTITEQNAITVAGGAARGAVAQASSQDMLAIMKFQQTEAAKKLREANEEIMQVILQIANNPDPEWMKKQNDTLVAAIIAFAEKPAPKRP